MSSLILGKMHFSKCAFLLGVFVFVTDMDHLLLCNIPEKGDNLGLWFGLEGNPIDPVLYGQLQQQWELPITMWEIHTWHTLGFPLSIFPIYSLYVKHH